MSDDSYRKAMLICMIVVNDYKNLMKPTRFLPQKCYYSGVQSKLVSQIISYLSCNNIISNYTGIDYTNRIITLAITHIS